MLLQR